MKIKLLLLLFLLIAVRFANAQTSAGQSFYVDFPSWNAGTHPPVYWNCGTSNVLNTGFEITMECWIRIYNSTWNQKILGKVTNTFNNGYVLAAEIGNYTELWDPGHYGLTSGTMPVDSAWVHLATTYAAGGQLTEYVNGVQVGQIPAGSSMISSSSNPFIIGIAPWDLVSYQTFGYLDEVRIWSVAHTAQEVHDYMFKHLQGNEAGLVAYYDFNQSSGNTLPDLTGNGNNGALNPSANYWSWQPSYAAVGGAWMYDMVDANAVWYGKDPSLYNYASTSNGLSIVATIAAKHPDYAVFGHNDSTGLSTSYLPAAASPDFQRLSREWYFNKGGSVNSTLYFHLGNAAGGGDTLPQNSPLEYYTLLSRDSGSQVFTAVSSADALLSGGMVVKFENVELENKYYTIGVGSTQLAQPLGLNELKLPAGINLFPNPANQSFTLTHVENSEISIYNSLGSLMKHVSSGEDMIRISTQGFVNGIYFVQVKTSQSVITKTLLVQ